MAGHLSPPIQAPATPPVPSPTQSSVLHCCLHGNATVFAPRPPASQDSLSEEVGQLQPEAPNCPPTLPPQVPLHFLPEGQGAGPASGRSCPWDWLLSRHGGCLLQLLSSLSSEPGPRRRTAHSAGLGSQGCGRAAQTTGQWALAPGWLLWDCTPLQPRVLPSRSAHLGRGARVGSLC